MINLQPSAYNHGILDLKKKDLIKLLKVYQLKARICWGLPGSAWKSRWSSKQQPEIKWNFYFYSCTYEKTYLAVHCTSEYIFCQFVDRKFVVSTLKYSLLADDAKQVSNFWP